MNIEATTTFEKFNLDPFLLEKLSKQQITSPTKIQDEAIPVALSKKDILGSAETGSGKTLAFGLPIVHMLHDSPDKKAVIIAPTRELAEQIAQNMQRLIPNRMSIALLIGGSSMHKQLQQLRGNPQIVIGTPGRMIDHLERKKLRLDDTSILVLDETDRMLDMGFTEQINAIVRETPDDRQTLLFSATVPRAIAETAKKFLVDPIRIKVGETTKPSDNITQVFMNIDQKHKLNTLFDECHKREGSVIIFVKTKRSADQLTQQLQREKLKADTIHGDLRHGKRQRVIRSFHQQRFRILVATDVAARGLDIPHIEHVINYDLPQCPEDYVHRIGRTARGGRKGDALTFVSQSDQFKLRAIKRFIGGDDNVDSSRPRNSKPKRNNRFSNSSSADSWNKRPSGRNFERGNQSSNENRRPARSSSDRYERGSQSSDGNRQPFARSSSDRYERDRPSSDGNRKPFARSSSDRYERDRPSSDGNRKPFERSSSDRYERDRPSSDGNRKPFERSSSDRYERDRPSSNGNKKPFARSSKPKSNRFEKSDNQPNRVFKKKESSSS